MNNIIRDRAWNQVTEKTHVYFNCGFSIKIASLETNLDKAESDLAEWLCYPIDVGAWSKFHGLNAWEHTGPEWEGDWQFATIFGADELE